ncbi:hypothetical protein [Dictyobacter arantiisoli]|uniref:hypothetical protein n=1 Tax=Dictyobacter arantiisoli TaxID=2014874 RepID=UPI0011EBF5ED|nr:hypothetical protein [Dictyobacter arantiisoli]
MSNNYTSRSDSGAMGNGSSANNRREMRAEHSTGALPSLGTLGIERTTSSGAFDFEHMVQSLRDLFEQDRQIASQTDASRCGICYHYFRVSELHYREEGFYVCPSCEQNLGHQHIFMLRKQQKL